MIGDSTRGTSSQSVAMIQSPLFGDSFGNQFNDIDIGLAANFIFLGFPGNLTLNVERPLKYITIMHGGVIDGIELEYTKNDGRALKLSHGTSSRHGSTGVQNSTVTLRDNENIVAVSGLHGSSLWGIRVLQLSFAICDTRTGRMRIEGPFGGGLSADNSDPQPFHITTNGSFVALGGFSINTDLTLGQLKRAGQNGGLYGLTFFDVAYRSV